MPPMPSPTRSPIKSKPLPLPGESLGRQLEEVVRDEVIACVVTSIVLLFIVVLEWLRFLFSVSPHPVSISLVAAAFILHAFIKCRRLLQRGRLLRLGIQGERCVGHSLDRLRADGYEVVHDIPEDGYNIDHVLVGPTGVFAIETKARSKPVGRDADIVYDGESIRVDGQLPDRDPIKQATAAADRVRQILRETTGHEVAVRPVVIYPGWYVRLTRRRPRVWVVNETYLQAWLAWEDESLSKEQVRLYASAVESHVRARM